MQAESAATLAPFPTKPITLMRVAGLTPFVAFLGRSGAPVEPLLAQARISPRVFDYPEGLIPVSQALRLMEDAALARGLENLGALAGTQTSIDALGFFGRLIRSSSTLGAAIETLIRTAPRFDSGGRYWLARRGDRVHLCHAFSRDLGPAHRQADQYWLMIALNVVRLGAGPTWRPDDIRLETPWARGVRQVEMLTDAHIVFEQAETAVSFPGTLLSRPLARPASIDRTDGHDVERWNATAPADGFVESILQVVSTLSSPTYPRLDEVAAAVGLSVRTLQRRLADAGASYERLRERSRFGTATRLLASTDATVLEIALDVGYSDHAHFTRAFRRWTGVPPREFRRKNGAYESRPAVVRNRVYPVGKRKVTTNLSPHMGPSSGRVA
jgi:AraC-like DNA-binding protein